MASNTRAATNDDSVPGYSRAAAFGTLFGWADGIAVDVFLLKALGASLAFGLAVLNLLIMLQLYGKVRLFPWMPESLAWWHRRQGDSRIYSVNASVPALAICAFCSEAAPDTPTAPRQAGRSLFISKPR